MQSVFLQIFLKHVLLAAIAFGCAGLFFLLTMDRIVMPYFQKTGQEIKTPNLIGTSYNDAVKMLRSLNLAVVSDSLEFNNNYPKDAITLQYPLPGTMIKLNREIKVHVSKGSKPLYIPNVIGMSRRNAEIVVKKAGFEIKDVALIHSNNYTRGIVAGQDPPGGQEVPENADVVLYISDGQPETNVTMPNLIELSIFAARDTLRAYDFDITKLQVHYVDAPEMLPNTVIDQHPGAGTLTHTSNEVTLDVSKSE